MSDYIRIRIWRDAVHRARAGRSITIREPLVLGQTVYVIGVDPITESADEPVLASVLSVRPANAGHVTVTLSFIKLLGAP